MKAIRKIIWAVDVFPSTPDMAAQAARAIRALISYSALQDHPVEIEPVYIRRPIQLDVESSTLLGQASPLNEEAKRNFNLVLSFAPLPEFTVLPLRTLSARTNSIRMAVKELVDYATESKADLIALCSHARTGMPRFFVGSFAESLILQCPVPVLVTNPSSRLSFDHFSTFLFPTDFSEKARAVYEQILPLAHESHAKVVVFHKLEYPFEEEAYALAPASVAIPSRTDTVLAIQDAGAEWVADAKSQGVEAKFLLCRSKQDIITSIARAAGKISSSLIVMTSQTGPIASLILGSTTRQVIRRVNRPVLVMHPPRETTKKNQSAAA